MKRFLHKKSERHAGAASLPSVVLLAILILALALQLTSGSVSEIFATANSSSGYQALQYAEAGARDALLRLARDKTYLCASADCYSLDLAASGCSSLSACAKISVAGTGSSGDPKIITAKGQAGNSVRRVQVSVVYDTDLNGEFQSVTWRELTN